MFSRHLRATLGVAAVLALATAIVDADVRGSKQDAEQLRQKLATITQYLPGRAARPHRTTISEQELNAYLAYDARPELPAGVIDPAITILGTGRVAARAVVDLDAVRRQKNPTSAFDPASYLTGRLPVTVAGVLRTNNGIGQFTLESATIGGVPVPKPLLQEIVSYYSRSPDMPNGVSLDNPFALPAHIREIQVERGQAVIVQ
ncbi:MAG: hypothetical protein ACM3SQ_14645 [Betaproteobacteria bacterium]